MPKKLIFIFFASYIFCVVGLVGMSTNATSTSSLSVTPSITTPIKNYALEPLFATISGGILTSGVFFFFFKRMLDQYDKKHEKNDTDIKTLKSDITELELSITDKLYDKTDSLHKELNDNLIVSTQTIVDSLSAIRETMQDLVVDFSALKAEHNKCDYKPGDIKLLQTQIGSLYSHHEKKHKTI